MATYTKLSSHAVLGPLMKRLDHQFPDIADFTHPSLRLCREGPSQLCMRFASPLPANTVLMVAKPVASVWNPILAPWLPVGELGALSVAFSPGLCLGNLHMVLGDIKDQGERMTLLRQMLALYHPERELDQIELPGKDECITGPPKYTGMPSPR
ncbi:hypothetical protein KIPB_004663 [Kipferlia bialata]|uniref:Uncharacterized protein n=1 Tax=Kipferlia bialata TaxID=797122 RepID=A0A391NLD0_9EUKA|nr:hypothetical protein KIPB_004663 [Kipferlia bialata]|eukprot:g4663.t1